MILLINGESSTGKTLMAQQLMEKYKIPYYSEDHIKMGWIKGQKDCPFDANDSNEKISDYLYPVLKGMFMTAIENQQHLIMEGCYILPEALRELSSENLCEIISINLIFSESYIRKNFVSQIIGKRNSIEKRMYPETRPVEKMIEEHQNFKKRCEQTENSYFEILENYEAELEQIYEWIDNEIKDRNLLVR